MKTKIEWCDYTVNCFWGCLKGCSYCQARRFARRFGRRIGEARHYPTDTVERMAKFEPVFLPDQLRQVSRIKKPSRIFISFMGDPFGGWNDPLCMRMVLNTARAYPSHTFIMLTKQPQNLRKWDFPDNVWPGVSVTANGDLTLALTSLASVKATVRIISFEPLLGRVGMADHMPLKGVVEWVIIGRQSPKSARTAPKVEWVKEIVEAADRAGAAVFLKDNLSGLLATNLRYFSKGPVERDIAWHLRQEFPAGMVGQPKAALR